MAATSAFLSWTLLLPVAAAPAPGDWWVDATGDCTNGNGTSGNPFCEVSDAIAVASAGDTIHVAPGIYDEALAVALDLDFVATGGAAVTELRNPGGTIMAITAPAAVALEGFTLADSTVAIEALAATDLVLRDCALEDLLGDAVVLPAGSSLEAEATTIARCQRGLLAHTSRVELTDCEIADMFVAGGDGAGIWADGCDLTLLRTRLLRCDSALVGGGLRAKGGTLVLEDCLVQRCKTGRTGVFVPGEGAGVALDAVSGSATGTTFDANAVAAGRIANGTALFLKGSAASFTVSRCAFTANLGTNIGGALTSDGATPLVVSDSSFEDNVALYGGAASTIGGRFERCRFLRNRATATGLTFFGSLGGACYDNFALTLVDCEFSDNVATGALIATGQGGAVWSESVTATRCRFRSNRAEGSLFGGNAGGGRGGAVHLVDLSPLGAPASTFTDCAFEGNVADHFGSSDGGRGAGCYVQDTAASFARCTLAGNRAICSFGPPASGATGGGIEVAGSAAVSLDHTIVAGNTATLGAPDLSGTATSLDWNCLGDTSGATLLGGATNDLLDVDPMFADAANGDWSLAAASPCVDSGDPALAPSGMDVAAFPRLLDGNLDRVLWLDRGAHEFCHVHLAITGAATPGGTITIASTGTSGLPALLIIGVAQGELPLKKLGALFVDLSQPAAVLAWPPLESSVDVDLDPALPVPLTLWFQELAAAGGAGNLSNLVRLDIE